LKESMDIQPQKSFKILVVGDACIDKYHYGYCERLSPEAPVIVLRHTHTEERGGMCLNVINNLIAFDQHVKIDKLYNKQIISKERFVDIKTKQHLLRFDMGEDGLLRPLSQSVLKKIKVGNYDALVISDYNKGFITPENASKLAEMCNEKKVPLFVDSKNPDLSCFEGAIIKINQGEFAAATAYPKNYELIVTLGHEGARWKQEEFRTQRCEVFDVSGAGDTFLAALVVEYLKTKSLSKAIKFANKCARIVVQKFGTYNLKAEDLRTL